MIFKHGRQLSKNNYSSYTTIEKASLHVAERLFGFDGGKTYLSHPMNYPGVHFCYQKLSSGL